MSLHQVRVGRVAVGALLAFAVAAGLPASVGEGSGQRARRAMGSLVGPRTYRRGLLPIRAALRCRERAAPALAVRGRLPRSGKSSRLIRSLRSLPRRVRMRLSDRCQAELLPVALRDLRGSQGPNSPRGIASPTFRLRRA